MILQEFCALLSFPKYFTPPYFNPPSQAIIVDHSLITHGLDVNICVHDKNAHNRLLSLKSGYKFSGFEIWFSFNKRVSSGSLLTNLLEGSIRVYIEQLLLIIGPLVETTTIFQTSNSLLFL